MPDAQAGARQQLDHGGVARHRGAQGLAADIQAKLVAR
jgi:hypothetical protein